jgi:hypothetical protein
MRLCACLRYWHALVCQVTFSELMIAPQLVHSLCVLACTCRGTLYTCDLRLARTIYIRCIYSIFGRESPKLQSYTVYF